MGVGNVVVWRVYPVRTNELRVFETRRRSSLESVTSPPTAMTLAWPSGHLKEVCSVNDVSKLASQYTIYLDIVWDAWKSRAAG